MIGMDFGSFIILLIIGAVVAAVAHYVAGYYVVVGVGSFLSKVVIGWLGAWLGTPVFGHWFAGVSYGDIYLIPAILGSIALVILVVDVARTFGGRQG